MQETQNTPTPIIHMNPMSLFLIFAWLAIVALSFTILSDFWLPMIIGAVVITLLIKLAR